MRKSAVETAPYIFPGSAPVFDLVLVSRCAGIGADWTRLEPGTVLCRVERFAESTGKYVIPMDADAPPDGELVDVVILDEVVDFQRPDGRKVDRWARVLIGGMVQESELYWDPHAADVTERRAALLERMRGIVVRPKPMLLGKNAPPRPPLNP